MRYLAFLLATLFAANALAQNPPAIPDRRIPPSVLAELRVIQDRFDEALAQDCSAERCFSKGCTYGDHAVADRPRATALPGLGEEKGPGAAPAQEYLTVARCAFAYERDMEAKDAAALARRLRTKLSNGWTSVEVGRQPLQPISPELREAPMPPEPPEEVIEEPPPIVEPPKQESWSGSVAVRELWLSLLPHFAWMIALVMVTIAALILIWGWRRLGRISPEEQALLAQMGAGEAKEDEAVVPEVTEEETPKEDSEEVFIGQQTAYWTERLSTNGQPDPDVQALIAEWLKAREMGLLAKAVLTFPEAFPKAFPDGGEFAESKLHFSEYLREVKPPELPTDEMFYKQLKQHALSASLARQDDVSSMATLRDEFGASGLVRFIQRLPARYGALLFAHASTNDQLEAARLLSSKQVSRIAEQLLHSNRMSRAESRYVMELLAASKVDAELPPPPDATEVTDLGRTFDAASALSILLPRAEQHDRNVLLTNAKIRFGGGFPAWYEDILFPEMVLALDPEQRQNVLLAVDSNALAGWISVLSDQNRAALLDSMSPTLRAAVVASARFESRNQQLEQFRRGREETAVALQQQLARTGVPFETVMV